MSNDIDLRYLILPIAHIARSQVSQSHHSRLCLLFADEECPSSTAAVGSLQLRFHTALVERPIGGHARLAKGAGEEECRLATRGIDDKGEDAPVLTNLGTKPYRTLVIELK